MIKILVLGSAEKVLGLQWGGLVTLKKLWDFYVRGQQGGEIKSVFLEAVFVQPTCFHIACVQPSVSLMKWSLDSTKAYYLLLNIVWSNAF